MPQKLDKVRIASVRRLAIREAVKVCAAVNLLCRRCKCTSFSTAPVFSSVETS